MRSHAKTVSSASKDGIAACGTCTKRYEVVEDLAHHCKIRHDNVQDCSCGVCTESFATIVALETHIDLAHLAAPVGDGGVQGIG